jgi:hypothetical protein
MNISKAVDKAYEGKSLKELADSPVDALQGLSAGDAQKLQDAFNVKSVRDLAKVRYFHWAAAIVALADAES